MSENRLPQDRAKCGNHALPSVHGVDDPRRVDVCQILAANGLPMPVQRDGYTFQVGAPEYVGRHRATEEAVA